MAETLAINAANISVSWNLENSTSFGTPSTNASGFTFSSTFSNGTGAGKAQKLFVDQVAVGGSGSQSYDLSGALTDPLGATVTFTNVKGLYIQHSTTTATGKLQIDGNFTQLATVTTQLITLGGTTPTAKINLFPGGSLFVCAGTTTAAGWTVTNTTADTLTLNNLDAASVTVKVIVFGE